MEKPSVANNNSAASTRGTTYYLTTPIYYVNDVPHIGHFYTTLACDVIARFKRLCGIEVLFTTGTDEHGNKIEEKAKSLEEKPLELVDRLSSTFKQLFIESGFTFDRFIRTTDAEHKNVVQGIWRKLEEKGLIYKGKYQGYYSVSDESFYTLPDLIDNKDGTFTVISSGSKAIPLEEESYFFKLSAFEKPLLDFYEQNPDFVKPKERLNEVKSFVESGLRDLSVSRLKIKWGIPVPGDNEHTIYVWLDALTNYLTCSGYLDSEAETNSLNGANLFKKFWPANLHMVGKDIIKFHAVYWPAFLMALDLELPKQIFAHGWWTNNKQKMSKSLGNAVKPQELIEEYGLDETKYFLLKEIPFGNDGDFNSSALISRINTELVNEYGNLCQRALSLVFSKLPRQKVTLPTQSASGDYEDFKSLIKEAYAKALEHINNCAFSLYLDSVWQVVRKLNAYLNIKAPWHLLKSENKEQLKEAEEVLYITLSALKDISLLLLPVIPNIAGSALDQLGWDNSKRDLLHLLQEEPTYEIKEKPTPIARKIITPEVGK